MFLFLQNKRHHRNIFIGFKEYYVALNTEQIKQTYGHFISFITSGNWMSQRAKHDEG
jgi:hypothetical protein